MHNTRAARNWSIEASSSPSMIIADPELSRCGAA
jgi:hypothetical protein